MLQKVSRVTTGTIRLRNGSFPSLGFGKGELARNGSKGEIVLWKRQTAEGQRDGYGH